MPTEREADILPRPTPEGVAFGVAASHLTYTYVSLLQAGLAVVISEQTRKLPPEVLVDSTVALFFATLIAGYLYELGTLRRKGFVLNYATTISYFETHDPRIATLIGTIIGQLGFFISPLDMGMTATSIVGDGGHLALANLLSRTAVGFANSIGLNYAIRQGVADKVLEKIQDLEKKLFPPNQFLDWPDNRSGDFPASQKKNLLD